ncbi:MAG: hypothetical protein ACREMW_05730 [Gemmatimonadales bacterium]
MQFSLHGRLHGWARGMAVLLLALQALAGGAVALAHAVDVQRGPVAVESGHSAQCGTLHDAARCAQCQYHATRTLPAVMRRARFTADPHRLSTCCAHVGQPAARPHLSTAPPRAPPVPLS